ncbi:hypothetical protein PHMEG_00013525 [Phytophthora megakarya]|uniref:CCHC-type domain-containing protein n=1 Tax=Phytophthora megakarya TaxID=4795 RepID=A0A225W6J2_9STRA|nr:hypothetical protein PHMEG_00013525 [Phytophthora megakarya]
MVGSAKNWHRKLSRTTKTKWADLLENFQTQYCGLGMSVVWHYYHARKGSEVTPLDYLYRLNVAALRAKLKIKDGNLKAHREHKAPASAPTAPARAAVRAIQAHDPSSESEGVSGSDGSDSEGDLRRIFLAAAEEKLISTGGASQNPDPARSRTKAFDGARISDRRSPRGRDHQDRENCSLCESRKHTDLDCWKRLICEKCGKRGHPTDRCLYACRVCGDVHEAGEYPMEEFYNQIRKWYDPTRHAGLFCIYAYVDKVTAVQGKKESGLRGNTCNLHSYTAKISSLPQISEFSRSNAKVTLISKEESLGVIGNVIPGEMVPISQDLRKDQSRESDHPPRYWCRCINLGYHICS